ncbi:MAG: endonuclease MutS2 [Anaerolineales bacterium]
MEAKSTYVLELPKVLEQLAEHAHFSASKALARALTPVFALDEANRRQQGTAEARLLLEDHSDLTIGGAHDIRPQVGEAARGLVLEPPDLLRIKDTLIAARTQARLLTGQQADLAVLLEIGSRLQVPESLIDRISQVLDERGEIRDTASDELAEIRRRSKLVHDQTMEKLQRIISSNRVAPLLQEPIVTQREGRFVLPLRAEYKGRLKSIVHDQSSSGATLFVEPLSVVDLNNEARELELAERDEIRRILAELSDSVADGQELLEGTVVALAELDLAYAKARYADEQDANRPGLKPPPTRGAAGGVETTFRLLGARHPLLPAGDVVPVDLALEGDTRALVITGPNTGGKTVALKTAGLLTLMALCGLQLPAEDGSQLSLFQAVHADIGDEQSIEQSLSTFSGHVSNIVRILSDADEQALVLLDELGAGTDPEEGAALAMSILEELVERGSTTLVATHYPELKAFAHLTTGVRNASVEFDLESLEPTYHLTIGLPGRSNALAIAERLGLPAAIIERSKEKLNPEDVQADQYLDEIHQQRKQAGIDRQAAAVALEQAEAGRFELTQRLNAIEQERRQALQEAREQGAEELAELQKEIGELRRQLALARQPLDVLNEVANAAEQLEEQTAQPVERRAIEPPLRGEPIQPGDRVYVKRLGSEGVVSEVGEQEAEVQVGKLRVRADLEELSLVQGSAPKKEAAAEFGSYRTSEISAPAVELDLRGQTVEEALLELDRRLDAAFMASLPHLRVIHGKGTGRLRQAVRQALRDSPYVTSFEAGGRREGGEGVTVIQLASR